MANLCFYDCNIIKATVQPYPDIAGLGVIISFVATTGIVVLLLFQYYLCAFDPRINPFQSAGDHFRPNSIDLFFLRVIRRQKLEKISSVATVQLESRSIYFEKCVLGLSDLQLGSGFAILIGGYSSLKCGLSAYHWQLTVYLAWFSASTHLAAMTFLRGFFHRNPAKRTWRIVAMSLFLVMLLVGIGPTGNYWISTRPASYAICSFRRHTREGVTVKTELALPNGTVLTNGLSLLNGSELVDGTSWNNTSYGLFSPLLGQYVSSDNGDVRVASAAYSYVDPLRGTFAPFVATIINQQSGNIDAKAVLGDSDSSAIVSMVILIFSFGVRIIKVYRTSSEWLNFKIRGLISTWLTKRLTQVCAWSKPEDKSIYWRCHLVYRPLLVFFILLRLCLDFYSSLLAEIYWLVVAVVWGILRLRIVRRSVPNTVLIGEASWTMGQVMPLVLIGLPLMAACEYFCRHRTTALAELELLPRRTTEPRPRSSNITVQQKANFNRESYEGSPWFKTSTWLTMIIILGTTVMVLNFVAEQADALNVIRRTLFPVVFTLCFVLFSFGIFAMLAHDIWPEKRSTRWANGFLTFWAIATTAGMLFLAVFIFWSLGSEMSSGYRGSGPDPNTSIAAIMIASAAAVFLLYAILCVRAGYLISRKVGAPAYIAV